MSSSSITKFLLKFTRPNLKYPTHIGEHFLVSPIKKSSLLLLQNLYNEKGKDKHSLILVPLLMEDKSYKIQGSLSFLKNKKDLEKVIIGLHNQLPILGHDIILNFSETKIIQTITFKNSDIYDNPVQLDNIINMQAVLQRIKNNEAKSFILYPKDSLLREPNAIRIISKPDSDLLNALKNIIDIKINENGNAEFNKQTLGVQGRIIDLLNKNILPLEMVTLYPLLE